MKVTLPLIVQDQAATAAKGMRSVESFNVDRDEVFLDGPVSSRLAVIDLHPTTNRLRRGAHFQPPVGSKPGTYAIANENDFESPDFMQVSVFATVLRTMEMFEEPDTLGRELAWAFGAPQLLIVPRAGKWANAFYERESHSLQFFHFPSRSPDNELTTVYTSLSADIVSHETGHAILDGIAPDLYNAITPQSLALHEAIADLTALVMSFRSRTVRETVLLQTNGSIEDSTAFTRLAEEFGAALDPERRKFYLRNLLNNRKLGDRDIDETDPHDLSEVLTGALYTVMVKLHEQEKRRIAETEQIPEYSASGKALFVAAERFQRMVFRALDYLPPGEISFADYGRAIIASDQAAHPDAPDGRRWICDEFVRRRIVADADALDVAPPRDEPALSEFDLPTLISSDWVAYDFANRHRELLGIPPNIPFEVRPRLKTTKREYHRDGPQDVVECLFKVAWRESEPNPRGRWFTDERQITGGTTLAIEWDEPPRLVRVCLTAHTPDQREPRDRMLLRLDDDNVLMPAHQATASDGQPLRSAIPVERGGASMRVRGTARTLHVAPREPPGGSGT
jgi:hypothetical protein